MGSSSNSKVMLVRVKHGLPYNPIFQATKLGGYDNWETSTAHVYCFATRISIGEDSSIGSLARNFLFPKGHFSNGKTLGLWKQEFFKEASERNPCLFQL